MSEFFIDKTYNYVNRFDLERFINFTEQYWDFIQSPMLDRLKTFKPFGQYLIREYPYRPDVVSYNIYGDPQYWPYILIYNGISDFMNLSLGTTLLFFNLDDLEQLLYTYSNYNNTLKR